MTTSLEKTDLRLRRLIGAGGRDRRRCSARHLIPGIA